MLRPPPPDSLFHFPVAGGTALLAMCVTAAWYMNYDVSVLFMTANWPRQPWRIIGSTLLHADLIHLAFNLYWLWVLGSFLEQRIGPLKLGGMMLAFAAGSSLAETAFLDGGVGLSGVVYGLFGFLWVMGRRDPVYWSAVDRGTAQLFVGWFFLCILLTASDIMRIGNIAHGAGALLGVVLAWACIVRRAERPLLGIQFALLVLASGVLASPILRPYVSYSPRYAAELALQAASALSDEKWEQAARLYGQAARIDPQTPEYWYCLHVVYSHLGQPDQARKALQRARELGLDLSRIDELLARASQPASQPSTRPRQLPMAPWDMESPQ